MLMRVAFISFHFIEYSIRWASGLANLADVMLMLPHDEHLAKLLDDRVRYLPIPPARMRHIGKQFRNMLMLWRALRDFRPDVIHVQQGFIWFNLLIPFLFRYPLVITVHDPEPHAGDADQKQPQAIFTFGFKRAQKLIVHGERIKDICVRHLGLLEKDIVVIPHIKLGEDHAEERPITSSTVLFFGRIWAYKGLDVLIRAEPLIASKIPDLKIMIAGTGEDFERYEALMTDRSRYIIHNTFIPDEAVADLFLQSAVVALPYLEATQSGVIPHAYNYGRPVVATRVGALPDAVDEGVTGLLVPPNDVNSFAEAIIRLLSDRGLAQRMGDAGRRKINEEASADAVARQSMDVYRQIVRG
jgi:glycosyltransferase involved in cell wall biosynthesis